MTTFPSQVSPLIGGPRAALNTLPQGLLAAPAALPLLVAAVMLASAAGLVPASRTSLGLALVFVLTGAVMAVIAFRFSDVFEWLRLRNIRHPGPSIEAFDTRDEFIERLEELTAGSRHVCFLDSSNMARRLAAAPRFMNPRCSPSQSYRHIANVKSKDELKDLLFFIRGRREAEKGTYFCVDETPLFFAALSFCIVVQEENDGGDVFLIQDEDKDWERAQVVLVRDREIGRFMLQEYNRLWKHLEGSQEPLLCKGELNTDVENQLQAAFAAKRMPEPLERAA